jgi:perosamine synthetase
MIPIYKPYLPEKASKYAIDAINSGWISSHGHYKNLAANKLSKILGSNYVLLTSNGTVATHLLLKALKFKHPHIKKIIVPNNVYVAAWNSLFFDANEYEIIVVDANINTWNADYSTLDIDEKSSDIAFLVVHNMGNIINVPQLKRKYKNAIFIEDNCEGIFGLYENQSSGTASMCSSLSFFGNKNITTGEGGAVLIQDIDVFKYLTKLHGQGQTDVKFIHDVLGYNYRMTNIHAALLLGQLEFYDEIKKKKQLIFSKYKDLLSKISGIYYQEEEPGCSSSCWLFGVRLAGNSSYEKTKCFFDMSGIETRPLFYPLTKHKHLEHIACTIKNADILNKECIILPSYPDITDNEIEYITDCVKKYYRNEVR